MIFGEGKRDSVYTYTNRMVITKNKKIYLYDKYGKEEASYDVEINNAIYDSKDKYLVVAEKNGKKVYVLHQKNIVWQSEIDGEIENVEINKNGYVVIKAHNSNYKSIIILYNSEGKEQFKKYLSNVVIDIGISEDNNYLAYAELNTSGVLAQSIIKILSIDKALKNNEDSIEYSYQADINKLILNIEYQNNNKLICMYDNSIDIIEKNNSRQLVNFENKNITFISIDFDDVVAVVEENTNNNEIESKVKIINTSNGKENIYVHNQVVKSIFSADNVLAVNYGKELHVIARNGWLVKKYISSREIDNVTISSKMVGIIEKNKILIFDI